MLPMEVETAFHNDDCGMPGGLTAFGVQCMYPYRNVVLHVYPHAFAMPDDCMERSLLHEALHVVLDSLCENRLAADKIFSEHVEMTIERLSFHIYHKLEKEKSRRSKPTKIIKSTKVKSV